MEYAHELHYPKFWPVYSAFWKEVNGVNLEAMVSIPIGDRVLVTTQLEEKIHANLRGGKRIKVVLSGGDVIGFIQFHLIEKETLFVDCLFVVPSCRYVGITRFIVNSFPLMKKCIFQVHKNLRPEIMLNGCMHATKIADSDIKDLELWEYTYDPESQGNNEKLLQFKAKQ